MKEPTTHEIARFWRSADIRGPDDCWLWTATTVAGCGMFHFQHECWQAPRFAFWLTTGVRPGELLVCHSCDDGLCINPKHLWLGTQKANMYDCARKGRIFHKLTKEEVLEIRAQRSAGISKQQLMSAYNVSSPTIWSIVNRKTWKHI